MHKNVIILIAEDDEGHVGLIKRNLRDAGLANKIMHFPDGQAVLNFLFREGDDQHRAKESSYLLLLDIRMPMVDGMEVLQRVKADEELRKMPVIMITTTDDPVEISRCHELGCSNYITKPINYDSFVEVIKQLGLFLSVVEIPKLNGA